MSIFNHFDEKWPARKATFKSSRANWYQNWVEMNEIRSEAICKTYRRQEKYHNMHLFSALKNSQPDKNVIF